MMRTLPLPSNHACIGLGRCRGAGRDGRLLLGLGGRKRRGSVEDRSTSGISKCGLWRTSNRSGPDPPGARRRAAHVHERGDGAYLPTRCARVVRQGQADRLDPGPPRGNSNALESSLYSDIPREAAARGMITVTPDAIGGNWELNPKGADDDFLVALVRTVETRYCVNLDHVHVAGFSLGSWKATTVACGHPDIFASVGLVSEEVHPTTCPPMPVIAFHGTADHIVPYGAGADPGVTVSGPNAGLPGVRYNIASWAKGGRCSSDKKVRNIGGDVVLWSYTGARPASTWNSSPFSTPITDGPVLRSSSHRRPPRSAPPSSSSTSSNPTHCDNAICD